MNEITQPARTAGALAEAALELAYAGRLADSLPLFDQSLALRPADADTLVSRGLVQRDLGDWEGARDSLARAVAAAPDHAYARYNLGCVLLTLGDYENGLPARLAGRHSVISENRLEVPAWRGEYLRDEYGGPGTLLLHSDGGLGDTIMLARYAGLCAPRAKVAFAGPPPLERLFGSLAGLDRFIPGPQPLRFHRQLAIEHLPLLWGTTPANVPASPYLAADPVAVAAWRARLGALPGIKVGICWAGNPDYPNDRGRSLAFEALRPLADIGGVTFVSLQKGGADWTQPAPGEAEGFGLVDWTGELGDFADTAALVTALDLVITVDTSVAHLAGALAAPVWLLNRFATDWRWGIGRDDCAWYPTLRQFRQPALGDWTPASAAAAAQLGRFARGECAAI